jgi:hypothetical protein
VVAVSFVCVHMGEPVLTRWAWVESVCPKSTRMLLCVAFCSKPVRCHQRSTWQGWAVKAELELRRGGTQGCYRCGQHLPLSLVSPALFETGSHFVAQAGLKLSVLLPQPPECWDYGHAPPHAAEKCYVKPVNRGPLRRKTGFYSADHPDGWFGCEKLRFKVGQGGKGRTQERQKKPRGLGSWSDVLSEDQGLREREESKGWGGVLAHRQVGPGADARNGGWPWCVGRLFALVLKVVLGVLPGKNSVTPQAW